MLHFLVRLHHRFHVGGRPSPRSRGEVVAKKARMAAGMAIVRVAVARVEEAVTSEKVGAIATVIEMAKALVEAAAKTALAEAAANTVLTEAAKTAATAKRVAAVTAMVVVEATVAGMGGDGADDGSMKERMG